MNDFNTCLQQKAVLKTAKNERCQKRGKQTRLDLEVFAVFSPLGRKFATNHNNTAAVENLYFRGAKICGLTVATKTGTETPAADDRSRPSRSQDDCVA